MKLAFLSTLAAASLFAAVPTIADVAGTRTIVISLTADEQGQIIPIIMHKNSAGYEPINIPTSSISEINNNTSSDSVQGLVDFSVDSNISDNSGAEAESSQEDSSASGDDGQDESLDSSKLETPFPAENTPTPDEQQTLSASPIAEAETESQAKESSGSLVDAAPETTVPTGNADLESDSDSDSDSEQEAEASSNGVGAQETKKSMAATRRSPSAAAAASAAAALAALLATAISI